MCGITGFLDHNNLITQKHLQNSSAAMAHRGGNGSGVLFENKSHYTIGLANERLATIDTTENGLQPFTSTCGNFVITFNGTIYNYIELRQELIKYGIIFLTLTDTEVLLEAYKKWGHKLFEKVDGAFAFAIFDRALNQLFIARDAVGVKPLYFYKSKNFFAFSSEIKGLLAYPNITKTINLKALQTYFRHGYFLGEETIFEGILSFKKQRIMVIDLNSGNSYEKPFNIENIPTEKQLQEPNIIQDVEELLKDSILKRSIADVPVGVLLSGGYDSATVAAILQKNQTKRIGTFTLGFDDKNFDEAPAAKKIATYLKTNHHEYYIGEQEAVEMLETLPKIFDEPMGDSGAIPLAYIASKINTEVKVILGAEGGDELFAGYTSYIKALRFYKLAQKLPRPLKRLILFTFKKRAGKMKEMFEAPDLLNTYINLTAFFSKDEISSLLNEPTELDSTAGIKNQLKDLLAYDLENYLPNDLLLKTDRIAMHYGIDNRDSMLKTDLISYLRNIDEKWFINHKQMKYLLKKITHKYIPESLMRRPKMGFSIPLNNWLKTYFRPHVDRYLSAEQLNRHNLFDISTVERIKIDFYEYGVNTNAKKIWLLLQFQMWYNEWMETK